MSHANDALSAQRLAQAGADVYQAILRSISDERGVHLQTAIAAAGYLAGTAILKSCGLDVSTLTPGSAVFTDRVNEIGPGVVQDVLNRVSSGVRSGPIDLNAPLAELVPPNHQPLRSYENLLPLLWPQCQAILDRHQVSMEQAAFACSAAVAKLILDGQAQLSVAIGKAIAIEAMVKASKTVPYLQAGSPAAEAARRRWAAPLVVRQ